MGCTGSKKDIKNQNPLEFVPKDIQENRPDAVRKEISELFKVYTSKRDAIKPLLAEKYGLQALIDDERLKSVTLIEKKDTLTQQLQPLLAQTYERDADDIYNAFHGFTKDKPLLVTILCARTYHQIGEIAKVFERKYHVRLIEKVINELTTVIGTILTGSSTGLSKLLTYRIMPQPERDAAMLKDCTDGMSLDDVGLLEVICTRTNLELRAAIFCFNQTYKKDLIELVRSKCSYKNYRDFVMKILECNRDEDNIPFPQATAQAFASELYQAGGARSFGMEPEPFIRILANCNYVQFESINEYYPNRALIKDITAKLGGDFQLAVLTRCTDKYDYFANRIETALRGFTGADTDTLCRILGCMSRPESLKLKFAYNRLGFKRTLDEAIRGALKSQQTYLSACLMLISEDLSITPCGSDKEPIEEEIEAGRESDRLVAAVWSSYSRDAAAKRGEDIMEEKRHPKRKLFTSVVSAGAIVPPPPVNISNDEDGKVDESLNNPPPPIPVIPPEDKDPVVEEEDRVLGFQWDGKGRFMDIAKLNTTFRELEYAENQANIMLDGLPDQIEALKGVYKAILKHRFETEVYTRMYTGQLRNLKDFVTRRDQLIKDASQNVKKK